MENRLSDYREMAPGETAAWSVWDGVRLYCSNFDGRVRVIDAGGLVVCWMEEEFRAEFERRVIGLLVSWGGVLPGDVLRWLRKALMKEQAWVASELGVSQGSVSTWERTEGRVFTSMAYRGLLLGFVDLDTLVKRGPEVNFELGNFLVAAGE